MNKKLVAKELLMVARDLLAIDFPTDDAMSKYLKEHPGADKSRHRVVKTQEEKTGDGVSDKDMEKAWKRDWDKRPVGRDGLLRDHGFDESLANHSWRDLPNEFKQSLVTRKGGPNPFPSR